MLSTCFHIKLNYRYSSATFHVGDKRSSSMEYRYITSKSWIYCLLLQKYPPKSKIFSVWLYLLAMWNLLKISYIPVMEAILYCIIQKTMTAYISYSGTHTVTCKKMFWFHKILFCFTRNSHSWNICQLILRPKPKPKRFHVWRLKKVEGQPLHLVSGRPFISATSWPFKDASAA